MLAELTDLWSIGGWVFLVLVGMAGAIWAALTNRWLHVRDLKKRLHGSGPKSLLNLLRENPSATSREATLYSVLQVLDHDKKLIAAMITVAPLLGLLGTVGGMIETFEGLGQQELFTQSGGVAGGIAAALFTTQMGLLVSVPALIFSRLLERQAQHVKERGLRVLVQSQEGA